MKSMMLLSVLVAIPVLSQAKTTRLTIMTFNVENLFDNTHDAGKNDYAFLPLAKKKNSEVKAKCAENPTATWRKNCLEWDWNDQVLATKLDRLGQAILQVNNGRGPDILILNEVENIAILERLRSEKLKAANYQPGILIEGSSSRGIDTAILTRLKIVGKPQLHQIQIPEIFFKEKKIENQDILQADFELPNKSLLTVFGVHFPAPVHPAQSREASFKELARLKDTLPVDRYVVAGGDFNVSKDEAEFLHPFEKTAENRWLVSHLIGCKSCTGTTFYQPRRQWSFLDALLLSKKFDPGSKKAGTWRLLSETIRAPNSAPGQKDADGLPQNFELPNPQGVSDHFPIALDIEFEGPK